MSTQSQLISRICKTQKMTEIVSKAIPILVNWAKNGQTSNHYKDLIRGIGYTTYSGIGKPLGYIEDIIRELSTIEYKDKDKIPSLNSLCTSSKNNLPSYGFEYIIDNYENLPIKVKKIIVDGFNKRAIDYKDWDNVLIKLGLSPVIINSDADETSIKKGSHTHHTESEHHIKLKKYIKDNPSSIGLKNVVYGDNETILLSGDRLDVYFIQKDQTRIAIEVKSKISSDADILRGIYQCVKYKSVLDAENKVHNYPYETKAILVIEGKLCDSNYQTKDLLGVEVIENFTY